MGFDLERYPGLPRESDYLRGALVLSKSAPPRLEYEASTFFLVLIVRKALGLRPQMVYRGRHESKGRNA